MPLSNTQLKDLYQIAKRYWLEAHSGLHAYDREFRSSKKTSDWLKRSTIASAAITAITAAIPSIAWLTPVTAIITAVVAAIDQMYAPAANTQKFWQCKTKLEGIKRDLVTCAITLDESKDIFEGTKPFNQIGSQIPEIMTIPTEITDDDKLKAQEQFRSSVIQNLIDRLDDETETESGSGADLLPDDAPDIVSAVRRRTGQ